ncbi:MAG TPA: transcriptional regulator [Mesotoga sp.]|nr:transcriptional regulator [Mesotoga sp.]
MESSELFWDSSIEELEAGYKLLNDSFVCLACGKTFEKGIVFKSSNDLLMDAEKAVNEHISSCHGSAFNTLLELDRKYTGLSEQQQTLMRLFYKGMGDKEIARELSLSQSTVRNYRFRLKEKARQAKIFLVLHLMMERSVGKEDRIVDVHRNATMIDERYAVTEAERNERVARFFGEDRKLARFPKREKDRVIVLREIAKVFKPGVKYTEEQTNENLRKFHDDYALLRRYLIEYGLIDRRPDGSCYWLVF